MTGPANEAWIGTIFNLACPHVQQVEVSLCQEFGDAISSA